MNKVLLVILFAVSFSVLLGSQDAFADTFAFSDDATGEEPQDIKSMVLLVASVGTQIAIFGLVGVIIAGAVGQTVWYIHRRKKSENSKSIYE